MKSTHRFTEACLIEFDLLLALHTMTGGGCLNITLCHVFQDLPTQPALVVVFFGTNDAAIPVPSGKGQAVPIEEFKGNLVKIASHLKVRLPTG